jgi:hypothetical protein
MTFSLPPPPFTKESIRQIYVDSQQLLIYETVNFFNYKHGAFTGKANEDTPPLVSLAISADADVHTNAEKATFWDLRHVQTEF